MGLIDIFTPFNHWNILCLTIQLLLGAHFYVYCSIPDFVEYIYICLNPLSVSGTRSEIVI